MNKHSTFPDIWLVDVRICSCDAFVLCLFLPLCPSCLCAPVCVCAGLLDQIHQTGSLPILRTISHPRPVLASEATKVTGPDAECSSCYTRAGPTRR